MGEVHYLSNKALNPEMRESAMKILEDHIQKPDPGSEFEQTVKKLSHLQPREQIHALQTFGFDTLFSFDKEVTGYIALRRDKPAKTVHVYRVHTEEKYREQGLAVANMAILVYDSFSNGCDLIQAGKGKDEKMTRVLDSLKSQHEQQLEACIEVMTGRITKASSAKPL
jgi:hypothetical protein